MPGIDLQGLDRDIALFRTATHSQKTIEGYACDWRSFARWCEQAKRISLPATEETVGYYVTSQLAEGRTVATCNRRVAAIASKHKGSNLDSPITPAIRSMLCGARRLRKEAPHQRAALVLDALKRAIAALDPAHVHTTRDKALLLFGFASALRRSTIASLCLADLTFDGRGVQVLLRREKQNQDGPARIVAIPFGVGETCPVRALQAWIGERGSNPGPLFVTFIWGKPCLKVRMSPDRIAKIVQDVVTRIGLDPGDYGAHSLRAGFVTEALERGVGELAVARQTGHRSLATLRLYFRSRDPFRGNASGAVGL